MTKIAIKEVKKSCVNVIKLLVTLRLISLQQDLRFDRMLTIDMVFPKTRIKRSVLFDFIDLVGQYLIIFYHLTFN